jgi:hypothetical protein
MEALAARLVTARKVGADDVRGVRATHYHLEINFPPPSFALQGFDCAPASATSEVRAADAWLDGAGRMVRLRMPFTLSASTQNAAHATPGTGAGFMTTEFFQFGKPVTISAPPAAQTFIDPSETSGPPTSEQGPCQDTAIGSGTGSVPAPSAPSRVH